jgi:hypothetical protein
MYVHHGYEYHGLVDSYKLNPHPLGLSALTPKPQIGLFVYNGLDLLCVVVISQDIKYIVGTLL